MFSPCLADGCRAGIFCIVISTSIHKTLPLCNKERRLGCDALKVEPIKVRVKTGFQMSGAAEPQAAGSTEALTNNGINYGNSDIK